jgi:sugar (pentulose or hexulose) kinase
MSIVLPFGVAKRCTWKQLQQNAAIGGGSKSALFNRIKADVLGVDVVTFETGRPLFWEAL